MILLIYKELVNKARRPVDKEVNCPRGYRAKPVKVIHVAQNSIVQKGNARQPDNNSHYMSPAGSARRLHPPPPIRAVLLI